MAIFLREKERKKTRNCKRDSWIKNLLVWYMMKFRRMSKWEARYHLSTSKPFRKKGLSQYSNVSIVIDGIHYKIDPVTKEAIASAHNIYRQIVVRDRILIGSEEYVVTTIGVCGFQGCKNLREVILPNTITSIRMAAFMECVNLQKISLGKNHINFGEAVFAGCNFNILEIDHRKK